MMKVADVSLPLLLIPWLVVAGGPASFVLDYPVSVAPAATRAFGSSLGPLALGPQVLVPVTLFGSCDGDNATTPK